MRIRYAREEDIEFLKEGLLNVRIIEKRRREDIPVTSSDIESFHKGIQNKTIRMIDGKDGLPKGFVYFRTDFPIPFVSGRYLWIDLIYVKEGDRGEGYGKALYHDAIKHAKKLGLDRIVLDIFEVNERSRSFHERLDFRPLYTIYTKKI